MKYLSYGVVVMGGGAAGMCAAIAAKTQTDASVVILEKRSEVGGNSAYAPLPDAEYYAVSDEILEQRYLNVMEKCRWQADARIVSTVVRGSREAVEWFYTQTQGLAGSLTERLEAKCRKLGIDILTNTAAQDLIKDGEGDVAAVLARASDGEPLVISAESFVCAGGGFMGDPELMERYFPLFDKDVLTRINYEGIVNGDIVKLALRAGVGDDGTASFEYGNKKLPFYHGEVGPLVQRLIDPQKTPEGMWINNVGVRFTNEYAEGSYDILYRQPGKDCFVVFDELILQELEKRDPSFSIETLREEMEPLIEADQAIMTASLPALAAWVRGKVHIIYAGMERYNQCCEQRRDFLFGKPKEYLLPFGKPPYYAFRLGMSMRTTHGPLKTNPQMSAVQQYDAPVPRLVACGADVGGMYAGGFIHPKGDSSIVMAITTGKMAGGHAGALYQGMHPAKQVEFPTFTAKQCMAGDYYNMSTEAAPAGFDPTIPFNTGNFGGPPPGMKVK